MLSPLLSVLVTFFLSLSAMARPVSAPHVTVELLAENTMSGPVMVGVHFRIEKGWHVYWRNPGDSGDAPRIRWTLPAGWQAGEIQWPKPERIPVPPLMNFGYEDSVLFMVPLTPPANSRAATVAADVSWLVCQESCIPGKARLDLQLPAAPSDTDPRLFEWTKKQIPKPLPGKWRVSAEKTDSGFDLAVKAPQALEGLVFFPAEMQIIENAAEQKFTKLETGGRLSLVASEQLTKPVNMLKGLLVTADGQGFEINTQVMGMPRNSGQGSESLLVMLFFALIGGLVLNLMPCVFPVLSLKVIGFLHHAKEEQHVLRRHGWAYTAGILVSFWVLVAALLGVRALGQSVGWGFQLQSPLFVLLVSVLLFFVGFNLLGVFEVGASWIGVGSRWASSTGVMGSFFTGVLATVVATPCTAPFMGAALGFALAQPALVCWLIFTCLALGLAAPYLAFSYFPQLGRWLPKPGRWMDTLKQVLSFPIFATTVWLLWVLGQQTGIDGMIRALEVICLSGFVIWGWHHWPRSMALKWIGVVAVVLSIVIGAPERVTQAAQGETVWKAFSPERVTQYQENGRSVFVDFTAAWCVTCQVNKRLVLNTADIQADFEKAQVVLLKADWTSYDPVITEVLSRFGRSGVPLYVLYPGHKDGKPQGAPIILSEVLTKERVREALAKLKEGGSQ